MNITNEKIEKNYSLFLELLKKYDAYSEDFIAKYGEKIKLASFACDDKIGYSFVGSLLETVIHKMCVIGCHVNDLALSNHATLQVEKKSLMKVLLLQHVSKAEMFIKTAEEWKMKKGINYDFNPNLKTSLKLGERSIMMCTQNGITFTDEEYEAMLALDKRDEVFNPYVSTLCEVVKITNNLSTLEIYNSK